MLHRLFFILLSILIVTLNGCSSSGHVKETGKKYVTAPPEGKAQVVFIRSSGFGGAVSAPIIEVTDNQIKPVTVLGAKQKTAYIVEPGLHDFIVTHESADLFKADLAENKTYFYMITPRMGLWKARFTPKAVKKSGGIYQVNSEEFLEIRESVGLSENKPSVLIWFDNNRDSIYEKLESAKKAWDSESQETKDLRTLVPEDGINTYLK